MNIDYYNMLLFLNVLFLKFSWTSFSYLNTFVSICCATVCLKRTKIVLTLIGESRCFSGLFVKPFSIYKVDRYAELILWGPYTEKFPSIGDGQFVDCEVTSVLSSTSFLRTVTVANLCSEILMTLYFVKGWNSLMSCADECICEY